MYFIRLISILIIFSTLSGCEFNIERVQELQSQIKTLEEKNEKLTNQLKSNKNAILSKNAELESCLIEVEKHESGLAEKHDFWFKVGILTISSYVIFLLCWIKFDYYLTEKKAPKKEEIEKSRNLIENEKSLVENERVEIHQLIQNKTSLLSEIEHLNEELEEKKEEVAREMEEEDRKLEKKKEEVARGIEEAEQQRQAALEKVAAAETKIKRLNAFKK
jgi:DNA repair exonuclease SbcCD ATPase subunit